MCQWVLNLPFQLRFLFASRAAIMGQVLGIVYRVIATQLIKKAGQTVTTAQTRGHAPTSTRSAVADPAAPVNGPFSGDFKWVTLPDGDGTPIRCTDGQAKVFEAL